MPEPVYPKEGEEKVEDDKTFIWTKRWVDHTCTIYEWIEEKPPAPVYNYEVYF